MTFYRNTTSCVGGKIKYMIRYHVKEIRESKRMSQRELCRRTGISRATISQLENGADIDIKVSTLKAIGKALGKSIATIVKDGDLDDRDSSRDKEVQT